MAITREQLHKDCETISKIVEKYEDNAGGICALTMQTDEDGSDITIMASGNMSRLAYMISNLCIHTAREIGEGILTEAWFAAIVKTVCENLEINLLHMATMLEFLRNKEDEETGVSEQEEK